MNLQDELKRLSETIRQRRDEAKVKLHLAREDVKDEWDDLEVHWERFRQKLDGILHDAEGVSDETKTTARKLGDELKDGYERIRKRLK